MKKIILSFFVFLYTFTIHAQNKKLDTFFTQLTEENKAMGTISIFKNGKEVYQKSIGFSSLNPKTKANKFTKYRIGSITKTFTATIIMQLVDEGKLQLNALLKQYFPKIPNAHKITIEDLLRHQSGLANITESKDLLSWIRKPQSRKQMIARFIKGGILFEPKEQSKYSNTNFIILSYIAEMIDKKPFATILNTRILNPLQLKRTEFGKQITIKNNEAFGYFFENKKWNPVGLQTHMSAPMGAGAITATPYELNVFFTNLFTEKLISKKSFKNLTTIQKGKGLGIMQFDFKNLKIYGHAGGIDGFQSFALYIPKKNVSMAFSFNGLNTLIMPTVIATLETYFKNDTSLKSKASIHLTSKELEAYLGTYSGKTFPAKVNFTKKGNTLFAQATGQPIFQLIATKKDGFIYDAMGISFEFKLSKKIVILNYGGNKHYLEKEE